jgi:hypothetical protein
MLKREKEESRKTANYAKVKKEERKREFARRRTFGPKRKKKNRKN